MPPTYHQVLTTKRLNEPDADNDFGSPQIRTLETVAVPHAFLDLTLHFVRVLDHGDCFIGVEVLLAAGRETEEGLLRSFSVALADVPPWRSKGQSRVLAKNIRGRRVPDVSG